MLQQAQDFLADVEVLAGLLETLSSDDWNRTTTFKSWTFNQVVQHLHGTDHVWQTLHSAMPMHSAQWPRLPVRLGKR